MKPQRKPDHNIDLSATFRIVEQSPATFADIRDVSAENAIISLVLQDVTILHTSGLQKTDFSDPDNAVIWYCLENIVNGGADKVDLELLMGDYMQIAKADIAKAVELIAMYNSIPALVTSQKTYANRVKQSAYLIKIKHEALTFANGGIKALKGASAGNISAAIENTFSLPTFQYVSAQKEQESAIDIGNSIISGSGKGAVTSHIGLIDSVLGGFTEGGIETIAGASGMGKTENAYELLIRAGQAGFPNWILFSGEMRRDLIIFRLISMLANLPMVKLYPNADGSSRLNPLEKNKVASAAKEIHSWQNIVIVDDYVTIRPANVVADTIMHETRLNRLTGKVEPLNVLIDGFWHMRDDLDEMGNEPKTVLHEQQVEILSKLRDWQQTGGLRHHAANSKQKHRKATLILIAQYHKGIFSRSDHRPQLSDIEGTKNIGHDSDRVWCLYRENRFNPDSTNNDLVWYNRKSRAGQIETPIILEYIDRRYVEADLDKMLSFE